MNIQDYGDTMVTRIRICTFLHNKIIPTIVIIVTFKQVIAIFSEK